MSATVETLDKLQRKLTLTLTPEQIEQEVSSRLEQLKRRVKISGFRPGKVPLSVVAQRYGHSVQEEVLQDQLSKAFYQVAEQTQLRVIAPPQINPIVVDTSDAKFSGQFVFEATFEVYPEVTLPDFNSIEVERVTAQVDQQAIDKTIDLLRQQRRSFSLRPSDAQVQAQDRVRVDFDGKIDGESFAGGGAQDFVFVVGEGQMLPEFENAVLGMKVKQSKTFQLNFPASYPGTQVAGKTADFMVTVKTIEASHLPELNDDLARSAGATGGTVQGLCDDIERNLKREVDARLKKINKLAALRELTRKTQIDLPKTMIDQECRRIVADHQAQYKRRAKADNDIPSIPHELVLEQAQQRVRDGLVLGELIRHHKLSASAQQVTEMIAELASSYEKPQEMIHWYQQDDSRLSGIRALIIENQATDLIFKHARVTDKTLTFADLMDRA